MDVNFYQMLPLYEDEMKYKVEHGAEALLEKFKETYPNGEFGVLDIKRKSVVSTRNEN
jgi:hypothetical protein